MVGAVVVSPTGEVLGEGYHRRYGEAHAETVALSQAGERARGATLYVTLEPCAHHGNTPPCADAVARAGVARVVACHGDPDPRTSGRGFERLRRAGIEVTVGERSDDALDLNLHFVLPLVLGRPSVSLKWAMTLDGKIATAAGESQWISSPAGRRWALGLREVHDAILVGSGTALADDPRLDRRLGLAPGPITRVVMDRRLRLASMAPSARLFEDLPERGPVLVYTDRSVAAASCAERRALEGAGATVVALPEVTPATVTEDLHARGVRSLLVEGGGQIAGAFRDAGLYDRVLVDVAPKLLGGGAQAPGPLGGDGVDRLADAARLDRIRVVRRGGDLIVTGLRTGCLQDLSASVVGY